MNFTVTTNVNAKQIKAAIKTKAAGSQAEFDALVLQDSNYFCPIKTGTLEKSAIINSRLGSGQLVWRTPYARRQYYEYHKPAYQPNPNACGKWFAAAKARWRDKWIRFLNERIKRI